MEGGRKKKRKDKEYEKLRTKIIYIFIWQKNLSQTYNALLDVESIAHDSWSPPPIHGSTTSNRIDEYVQRSIWGLSTSRVQHLLTPSYCPRELVLSFHHAMRQRPGSGWVEGLGWVERNKQGIAVRACYRWTLPRQLDEEQSRKRSEICLEPEILPSLHRLPCRPSPATIAAHASTGRIAPSQAGTYYIEILYLHSSSWAKRKLLIVPFMGQSLPIRSPRRHPHPRTTMAMNKSSKTGQCCRRDSWQVPSICVLPVGLFTSRVVFAQQP